MNCLPLDRMKRRQKERRLDTLQRYGMFVFITVVSLWGVTDLLLKFI